MYKGVVITFYNDHDVIQDTYRQFFYNMQASISNN